MEISRQNRAFCNSWSRDQLSVNMKTVRCSLRSPRLRYTAEDLQVT